MENLHEKTALVTGAAKRIGRTLALTLAEAGSHVAITYKGSKTEAVATVEALKKLNVRAMSVECDVRDEKGKLLARASSTCMTLRGEHATGR